MSARPDFLQNTPWEDAASEPLTGDASARKYFRLRQGVETAILMDASRIPETIAPFIQIGTHLQQLGFRAPKILFRDAAQGFLLLEDFGDNTFALLLDNHFDAEELFTLATDVLSALHRHPNAAPEGLRSYSPDKMLEDAELFLAVHEISGAGVGAFRKAWRDVLPLAHDVPASLLLRDYHAANLLLLPDGEGIRRAGLLDFQDAYRGPVTYDLVSLLEDARRDLPPGLKEKMISRYLGQFPKIDRATFEASMAILAALRHTRVLAVFEKLSREGKPEYKKLHSLRVERLLQEALRHPKLDALKRWFATYAK
ncbi:MAG: aminoglycoside phosphotransferase family protein [Limisphaerales bacterium]